MKRIFILCLSLVFAVFAAQAQDDNVRVESEYEMEYEGGAEFDAEEEVEYVPADECRSFFGHIGHGIKRGGKAVGQAASWTWGKVTGAFREVGDSEDDTLGNIRGEDDGTSNEDPLLDEGDDTMGELGDSEDDTMGELGDPEDDTTGELERDAEQAGEDIEREADEFGQGIENEADELQNEAEEAQTDVEEEMDYVDHSVDAEVEEMEGQTIEAEEIDIKAREGKTKVDVKTKEGKSREYELHHNN
ncbi:MAG: hypothetical protein ACK40G_10335 [Cytophagaceae bacterium]